MMLVFGTRAAMAVAQQHPLPLVTLLSTGWNQSFERGAGNYPTPTGTNSTTVYKLPTIAIEQSLGHNLSLNIGLGLDFVKRPLSTTYKKFDNQFFGEFRYYFLLRQGRQLSGIYCGLFGAASRERWLYQGGTRVAIRRAFEDVGLSLGYQHAIGNHIRFNQGVTAGYHSITREFHFDSYGGLIGEYAIRVNVYGALWYIKVGYVF